MATGFVLSGQVQLRPPSSANLAAITSSINGALAKTQANININVNPSTTKALNNVNQSLQQIPKSAKKAGDSLFNFGKQSALAVQRFFALTVATKTFFDFTQGFVRGIKDAIEFQREMTKVRQVTNRSMEGLRDFNDEITRLATSLGVSSKKILEVGLVLSQAGLSAKQTTVALQALAKSELAPTFDDIISTSEAAIAVFQQFGVAAEDLEGVLGSINAVSAKFAVEASDISAVIRRTGGAFAAAGGNLNELIALFTSVRQTTRESAESIATGFRTIFTRIQRLRTIDFLSNIGIQLRDLNGQFVGPLKAIEALHNALTQIPGTDPRFSQIIEELGGFRQVSKVIPLIQQFAVTQKALRVAQQGTNSLTEDAAKAQDALAIKIQKVKEEFAAFIRQITGTSAFKSIIDIALKLASSFIQVGKVLENVIPLFVGLGAVKLGRALKPLGQGFRSHIGFNQGGSVPGSGNTDSVPAALTPGEFVLNKRSASRIGTSTLNRLNKGGFVKFADGGLVQKVQIPDAETGRITPKSIRKHLLEEGFTPSDAQTRDIAKTIRSMGKGLATESMLQDELNKLTKGGQLSAIQKKNTPVDIQLGGGVNNPSFAGLFLTLGGQSTQRFKSKVPQNLFSLAKQKAKVEKFLLEDDAKVITNFQFGGINKKSRDNIHDYIFSLFTSSISKVLGNFGQGLGVQPGDKTAIEAIARGANLAGVEGGIFEGFVSAVSNNLKGHSNTVFDFSNDLHSNPGLKKLFGDIKPSVKFADAKGRANANSIKNDESSLFNKAITTAIADQSLINFIPKGDIRKEKLRSFGEELPAKFAAGGLVPGSGNTDSVRANLTPGEFVLRKKAVESIGVTKLHKLNRFAKGGMAREEFQEVIRPIFFKRQDRLYESLLALSEGPLYPQLATKIPKSSKYLANGVEAIALKTPDNKVIRIGPTGVGRSGFKIPGRPKDSLHLQPLDSLIVPPFILEILEFAHVLRTFQDKIRGKGTVMAGTKFPLSAKRKQKIQSGFFNRLLSQGKLGSDLHTANIGKIGNKFKIIDPNVIAGPEELAMFKVMAQDPTLINSRTTNPEARKHLKFLTEVVKSNSDKFGPLSSNSSIPDSPTLSSISSFNPNNIKTLTQQLKLDRKARGGSVDSVPALLTPGEFVVNKSAASKIGLRTLNKLNHADKVKKFQTGGATGPIKQEGDFGNRLFGIAIAGTVITNLITQMDGVSDGLKNLITTLTAIGVSFGTFKSGLQTVGQTAKRFTEEGIIKRFTEKEQPLNNSIKASIKRQAEFQDKSQNLGRTLASTKFKEEKLRDNARRLSAFPDVQNKLIQQADNLRQKRIEIATKYVKEGRAIQRDIDERNKNSDTLLELRKQRNREIIAARRNEKQLETLTGAISLLAASSIALGGILSNRGRELIKSSGGAQGRESLERGGALSGGGFGALVGFGIGSKTGNPIIAAFTTTLGASIGSIIGFANAAEEATLAIEKVKFDKKTEEVFTKLDRAVSGKISSFATLSDARVTAKTFDERLLVASGSDFEDAIGQRKDFAEKLQVVLDNIAQSSSNFEDFISKLGGQDKADVLFKSLSKTVGSSTKELTEQFTKLISVTSKQVQFTTNLNDARQVEFTRLRLLNDLNKNLDKAVTKLNSDVISTIGGESRISTTRSPASPEFIKSFSKFFGDQAGTFADEIQQSLKTQDVIGRALVNVRNTNPLNTEDVDASASVLAELTNLGITDDNVRRIVQTQIGQIIGPEAKDARFFEDLNEDIEGVTSKLTEALNVLPNTFFDFTTKFISGNNDYLAAQRNRLSVERDLIKGIQDVADIRRNREEFLAKAGDRSVNFGLLNTLNEDKRRAILGGLPGDTAAGIGASLAKDRELIETNAAKLNTGLGLSIDEEIKARDKLTEEVRAAEERILRFTAALEFMADTSNKVAIAQAKFDDEFSKRQVKQGFAENFAFSDVTGRRSLLKDIAGTLVAGRAGDLGAIPASGRPGVAAILDIFKDVPLAAFGGRKGREVKLDLTKSELKKLGFSDKELEGITNPGDAEEKARLEVLTALTEAEASRIELNKNLAAIAKEQKDTLGKQFNDFLKEFKVLLEKSLKTDIATRSSEFIGSGVKLARVEESFAKLEKLGVRGDVLRDPGELKRLKNQLAAFNDLEKTKKELLKIANINLESSSLVAKLDQPFQGLVDFFGGGERGELTSDEIIEQNKSRFKNLGIDLSSINLDNDATVVNKEERSLLFEQFRKQLEPSLGQPIINEIEKEFNRITNKADKGTFLNQARRLPRLGENLDTVTIFNLVKTLDDVLSRQVNSLNKTITDAPDLSEFGQIAVANIAKINDEISKLPDNLKFSDLSLEVVNSKDKFIALNEAIDPTIDFFTEVAETKKRQDFAQFKKDPISRIGFGVHNPAIPGFARGGLVPGIGVKDKIPAMLAPGEFIINRKAASKNISFLKMINSVKTAVKPLDPRLLRVPEISPDPTEFGGIDDDLKAKIRGFKKDGRTTFERLPANIRESIIKRSQNRRSRRRGNPLFDNIRNSRREAFLQNKELRQLSLINRKRAKQDLPPLNPDVKAKRVDLVAEEKARLEKRRVTTNLANVALMGLPFNEGGEVPALLTPGELVFGPNSVNSIGLQNLNKLNDVTKVPGVGNHDSVRANVQSGSFVLNKNGSNLIKRERGGIVKNLGNLQNIQNLQNMSPQDESGFNDSVTRFATVANRLAQSLDNMPREISFIGRMTHEVIITGGEALANSIRTKLEPVFKEMVEDIVGKQITELKKDFGMNNG